MSAKSLPPEIWLDVIDQLARSLDFNDEATFTKYCFVNKLWFDKLGSYYYKEWRRPWKLLVKKYKQGLVMTKKERDAFRQRYMSHIAQFDTATETYCTNKYMDMCNFYEVMRWGAGQFGEFPGLKLVIVNDVTLFKLGKLFTASVEKIEFSVCVPFRYHASEIMNRMRLYCALSPRLIHVRFNLSTPTFRYIHDEDWTQLPLKSFGIEMERGLSLMAVLRKLNNRQLDELEVVGPIVGPDWLSNEVCGLATNLTKLKLVFLDNNLVESLDHVVAFVANTRLSVLEICCSDKAIDWGKVAACRWKCDTLHQLNIVLGPPKQLWIHHWATAKVSTPQSSWEYQVPVETPERYPEWLRFQTLMKRMLPGLVQVCLIARVTAAPQTDRITREEAVLNQQFPMF